MKSKRHQSDPKPANDPVPLASLPARKQKDLMWPILAATLIKLQELDDLRQSLECLLEGKVPPPNSGALLTLAHAANALGVQPRTLRRHCAELRIDPEKPLDGKAIERLRASLSDSRRRQHLAERNRRQASAKKNLMNSA